MALAEIPRRAADDTLEQLLDKIDEVVASTVPSLTLAAARKACNEAGVPSYQRQIDEALGQYPAAQEAKREADHRLSVAKEMLAEAEAEAEWALSARFEVRSNKTYLAIDDNGKPIAEADQRSLTADEKKQWLARKVRDDIDETVTSAVANAEARVRECVDDLALRDRTLQALRHQLDAAVAELTTYRLALSANTTRETR